MILTLTNEISNAEKLLKSAYSLSQQLEKEFAVLVASDTEKKQITEMLPQVPNIRFIGDEFDESRIADICEKYEVSFLFIQWNDSSKKKILQKQLNACRELRIPYVFFKNSFDELQPKKVLVPVSFLEEEYEKAQFAAAFGRFYGANITILLAKDYGSKARVTAGKMTTLFEKFNLDVTHEQGEKDSFKIEYEAIENAKRESFGIVLVTASRDYGLDDILFGPKELHLILKSTVPLLIVNPRGDLYALCD